MVFNFILYLYEGASVINSRRSQMDLALWHKFTQHESLKRELLATDDAELIEVGVF